MKYLIEKDKKKRKIVYKYNSLKFIIKNISLNKNFNTTLRWNINFYLSNLPKNSSKTVISNRCIITGRKSSINKKFKLSRLSLLRQSRSGKISGLLKV